MKDHIDRVTVKRGYEIEVRFKITVDEFSGADAKGIEQNGRQVAVNE